MDIINYIQGNDNLLRALFISFRDFNAGESSRDADNDEHRRDVVMLLHQLVLMGKNVQLANRLQLYRNLVDRGLLYVCEWGFRQTDTKVLNASTEMLALILEHDVSAVRSHALRENEMKRKTLVIECTDLLKTSKDMGIKSQIADSLKSMLDIGGDGAEPGLVSWGFGGFASGHCSSTRDLPAAEGAERRPHRRFVRCLFLRTVRQHDVRTDAGRARLQELEEWVWEFQRDLRDIG